MTVVETFRIFFTFNCLTEITVESSRKITCYYLLSNVVRQQFIVYDLPVSSFFMMSYAKIIKIDWFFTELIKK